MNLTSSSHGEDGNQDGQEDPSCQGGDNANDDEYKESLSGANKEKEEEVSTVMLLIHVLATESQPSKLKCRRYSSD